MTRRGVGLACVAMLAAIAVVPAAHAQTSAPVQFERGSFGATINGTIIGDEYIDYTLGAKAGQEMTVAMSASVATWYSSFDVGCVNGHDIAAISSGVTIIE